MAVRRAATLILALGAGVALEQAVDRGALPYADIEPMIIAALGLAETAGRSP
jgi:hypothetical protein